MTLQRTYERFDSKCRTIFVTKSKNSSKCWQILWKLINQHTAISIIELNNKKQHKKWDVELLARSFHPMIVDVYVSSTFGTLNTLTMPHCQRQFYTFGLIDVCYETWRKRKSKRERNAKKSPNGMKDTMCIVRKAGSGNNRVFTAHFSVYCAELFYAKSVETFLLFYFLFMDSIS